jgi:hypothetical protein
MKPKETSRRVILEGKRKQSDYIETEADAL